MGRLDLHMHSNCSNDGEYSPKQLMELCKAAGLNVVALTDHNCVRGVKEAEFYAFEYGMQLVKAVELDCSFRDTDLHVLGYGIDVTNKGYEEIEMDILNQEQRTSGKRMELIRELGIYFDPEKLMQLSKDGVITGEMIAEVALEEKLNRDNVLLEPYYPGGNRSDNPYVNFYWDFCAKGKPAYVPMNFIDLAEAIQLITVTGGVPVLAHPGINVKEKEDLLAAIIREGIQGIEVYSSYHSAEQIKFYEIQCDRYGLIKTVGSDFHGKIKPSVKLGSDVCVETEEVIFRELKSKIEKTGAKN